VVERAAHLVVGEPRAREGARGPRVVVREVVLAGRVAGGDRVRVQAVRLQGREAVFAHQTAQAVGGRLRARAVGSGVQEGHGGLDLVRVGLLQGLDGLPAEVRGPEQPGMPHLVAMQQADHRTGGQQLAGRVVHDRDERGRRVAALAGVDRGQGAVRGGDRRQIAAHALHALPAAAPDDIQDAQRVPGVQRLADRAAKIGLQRVAVPAVLGAVGVQRRLHRVGVTVEEVVREEALFQHARGEPHELLGAEERRARRRRRGEWGSSCFGHASDRRGESGLGKRSRHRPTP
jgi:hypothetical protein